MRSPVGLRALDVRTADEYEQLGHVPDAALLPVDLLAAALVTLPREGDPLLVYCEHGIRSRAAVEFLHVHGYDKLLHLDGGMSAWQGPRDFTPPDSDKILGPSSWLLENADLLPRLGPIQAHREESCSGAMNRKNSNRTGESDQVTQVSRGGNKQTDFTGG